MTTIEKDTKKQLAYFAIVRCFGTQSKITTGGTKHKTGRTGFKDNENERIAIVTVKEKSEILLLRLMQFRISPFNNSYSFIKLSSAVINIEI